MSIENESKDRAQNVRNEFKELPIERKIATLIELETMTMAEGFETVAERSISLGKRIFDCIFPVTEGSGSDESRRASQKK